MKSFHLDNPRADEFLDLAHHTWVLHVLLCRLWVLLQIHQHLSTKPQTAGRITTTAKIKGRIHIGLGNYCSVLLKYHMTELQSNGTPPAFTMRAREGVAKINNYRGTQGSLLCPLLWAFLYQKEEKKGSSLGWHQSIIQVCGVIRVLTSPTNQRISISPESLR